MQTIPVNTLSQQILNNRGNATFMDSLIQEMEILKSKFSWQMNKFLEEHCRGVTGLDKLELNTSSVHYRYYNAKCDQYRNAERIIAMAKAYK